MKQPASIIVFVLLSNILFAQKNTGVPSGDAQIIEKIEKNKPLNHGLIPSDLRQRLGATHTSGKYFLTDQPYLIEGAKKLDSLGFGILKLWFYKTPQNSYLYNSHWRFNKKNTLAQLAQEEYFRQAFDFPFSTIILSTSAMSDKKIWLLSDADLKQEEEEIYGLCNYLLKTYKKRKLTFIIQNWEGDWIYRSGTDSGTKWKPDYYPKDTDQRAQGMQKWFEVRQRGVTRARNDNKGSVCKIYHAIEVNRVMECMKGIPGLVTCVLPKVQTDMVSWSCYDGLTDDGVQLYKGIDYIKSQMLPSATKEKTVFIGEIGIPENVAYHGSEEKIIKAWDTYMGVLLAQKIPYVVHWELYCNEAKDDSQAYYPPKKAEEMRGFWLLRPDGSAGFALKYFEKLLRNTGKKIH